MNINEFIFTRTQPRKKIESIKNLTRDELFSVGEETMKRIIKEVGRNYYKSRDKELHICNDRQKGNAWNSTIESVSLIKGRLYLNAYVQYENTDTNTSERYGDFFRRGEFRGEVRRLDRYGNGRTYYFCYDESDKAEVMRSLLLEYVYKKYPNKVKEDLV